MLTFDTASLLAAHAHAVELAHLNTGAVFRGARYPRGARTFSPIATYPWADRLRIAPAESIVELTIPYALPNAADLVIEVRTR